MARPAAMKSSARDTRDWISDCSKTGTPIICKGAGCQRFSSQNPSSLPRSHAPQVLIKCRLKASAGLIASSVFSGSRSHRWMSAEIGVV